MLAKAAIINGLLDSIDETTSTVEVPVGKSKLVKTMNFEVRESKEVLGGFRFQNQRVFIDNTFEKFSFFLSFSADLEIYFAEQLKLV